ncbi:MAG: protein kinase [Clostridiales bacterium]|jgi:beta-lactam-binding protein with PASTA domain|nr:protein kinase [Clostridiales bacterium]
MEQIVLGNRYELHEEIGSGGMAHVFKARDILLDRIVAIKILKPEFTEDAQFIDRFRIEAKAAASLSNANIVMIYDVGQDDGVYYIIMEYVDGITLKDYIASVGRIGWKEAAALAIQMTQAIDSAHSNHIIHRDIKPQNILITRDRKIKITDFGIARAASNSTMTTVGNAMGSVHYFSPEQAKGSFTDEKSDIYSLGITLYEMVTGEAPFDGETPIAVALKHIQEPPIPPSRRNPQIPSGLDAVILKSIEKDKFDRYQSMGEMLSDLKKVLKDPSGKSLRIAAKAGPVYANERLADGRAADGRAADGRAGGGRPANERGANDRGADGAYDDGGVYDNGGAYGAEGGYENDRGGYAAANDGYENARGGYAGDLPAGVSNEAYADGRDEFDDYDYADDDPRQGADMNGRPTGRAQRGRAPAPARNTRNGGGGGNGAGNRGNAARGARSASGSHGGGNNNRGNGGGGGGRGQSTVFVVVSLVAVAVAIGFMVWILNNLFGVIQPPGGGGAEAGFSVGNYVGLDYDVVSAQLRDEGIKTQENRVANDLVEAGRITDQNVPVGRILKRDGSDQIVFEVSDGVSRFEIPDYRERDTESRTAEAELRANGLEVEVLEESGTQVRKGYVVRTEPSAGAKLEAGSKIVLYRSSGIETNQTTVPQIVGKTYREALLLLDEYKLTLGTVTPEETVTSAIVIRQSIAPNTIVDEGVSIDLSFEGAEVTTTEAVTQAPAGTATPEPTPTPDPNATPTPDPNATPTPDPDADGAGRTPRPGDASSESQPPTETETTTAAPEPVNMTIRLTLPVDRQYEETVKVLVEAVPSDTGRLIRLLNRSVKRDAFPRTLDFTIPANGSIELKVYYDGELMQTQTFVANE